MCACVCLWGFDDNVRRIFFHVFANSFSQKKQISKTNVMSCHNHYQNIEFWLWWSYLIILSFKGIILWILGNNFIGTIVVCIDNFGFGHFWCVLFIYLFGWIWKKWWWLVGGGGDWCVWMMIANFFFFFDDLIVKDKKKWKKIFDELKKTTGKQASQNEPMLFFKCKFGFFFLVKEFSNKNTKILENDFFFWKNFFFRTLTKRWRTNEWWWWWLKWLWRRKRKRESNRTKQAAIDNEQCNAFFLLSFFAHIDRF